MTISEFKTEIEKLFPVKRESDDFRDDLRKVLKEYKKLIDSLDEDIKQQQSNWDNQITRIDKLITGIRNCVSSYYERAHNTAYITMLNQMIGIATITGVFTSIELYTIKEGEYLWRGRRFEKKSGRTHSDMFHIPFEKRGFVKTQRYSAPGYPCLYLGTTIYSCWEELGRDKFDDLMVSGFRAIKNIKLLNLCRPEKEEYCEKKLPNLLLRLPLILACSFEIKDSDEKADFKPEYIIPQMLIEVIINKNNKDRKQKKQKIDELILGIIYTSTHMNNEFNYPEYVFKNIAIPAIDVSNPTGHCSELADCFLVTNPTCNEYEELKKNITDTMVSYGDTEGDSYTKSKMGDLESRIKKITPNKITYLRIRNSDNEPLNEINLPQDGSATLIQVRTNANDWTIK